VLEIQSFELLAPFADMDRPGLEQILQPFAGMSNAREVHHFAAQVAPENLEGFGKRRAVHGQSARHHVMPDETAAAAPPLDPPVDRSKDHGFKVGPYSRGSLETSKPSSHIDDLPTGTRPSRSKREMKGYAFVEGASLFERDAARAGMPGYSSESLMRYGTPASGVLLFSLAADRAPWRPSNAPVPLVHVRRVGRCVTHHRA
jgi:hypothetical protein